jgi:hypothetical protein
MRGWIALRVQRQENAEGIILIVIHYARNHRRRRTVVYSFLTLFPRFACDAVVPRWIRFISAFPARRSVPAFNQKLNVSGTEASRVSAESA